MWMRLSLNRLWMCIWFYHKHSCTCSTEFPAPYGMPDIFPTSGLDAPKTTEADGKLSWHVSINLGAGYECSGAIIQSQWILTDAHCVYNLWATNMQETFKKLPLEKDIQTYSKQYSTFFMIDHFFVGKNDIWDFYQWEQEAQRNRWEGHRQEE